NLRVVLVNPSNGRAVVASQELRGPNGKCEGHDEDEHVSLKKDELKDKGRLAACSYEVVWRLGLQRSGAGDPVVLMAFVPATTPLGPVSDDKVFSLRKAASREQIAGSAEVPDKLAPPPRASAKKVAAGKGAAPPAAPQPTEKQPKNAGPNQPTPAA